MGGLHPGGLRLGGLCPGGVFVQGGSLARGALSRGVSVRGGGQEISVQGGLCPEGVSVMETPHGNERTVRILLECIPKIFQVRFARHMMQLEQ